MYISQNLKLVEEESGDQVTETTTCSLSVPGPGYAVSHGLTPSKKWPEPPTDRVSQEKTQPAKKKSRKAEEEETDEETTDSSDDEELMVLDDESDLYIDMGVMGPEAESDNNDDEV